MHGCDKNILKILRRVAIVSSILQWTKYIYPSKISSQSRYVIKIVYLLGDIVLRIVKRILEYLKHTLKTRSHFKNCFIISLNCTLKMFISHL